MQSMKGIVLTKKKKEAIGIAIIVVTLGDMARAYLKLKNVKLSFLLFPTDILAEKLFIQQTS